VTDLVKVLRIHELLKFLQDIVALAWIEAFFALLEALELEEQVEELLKPRAFVDVDIQDSLKRSLALRELIHRCEVDWVTPEDVILLCQNFAVACQDVSGVLLEETLQP
jgi:hypothetical protein